MNVQDDYPMRNWNRDTSIVFRKTREEWGWLSNMAAGFPIEIAGTVWSTSEALYQALRFPDHPEVQELILNEKSPMAAKMKSKPHRADSSRADWDDVRVEVMYWCLQAKLVANPNTFGDQLTSTKKLDIVEDSSKDRFWGAVAEDDERLAGRNVLGSLLMKLRREYVVGDELWATGTLAVPEPKFGHCRLMGRLVTPDQVGPVQSRDTLF